MEAVKSIDRREFLIEKVLSNFSDDRQEKFVEDQLAILRKEIITKPVIYIGAGTCGYGAGAGKTIDTAEKYLEDNGIDAELIKVGCIGFCSAEPLMDIHLPGKNRLSFQHVTGDKVENIT